MNTKWSDKALDRVGEIVGFIAADDLEAAVRWAVGLFVAVERLAEFPGSGRVVPEIDDPDIREILYGAYRVLYHLEESVHVLTVRHGTQLLREANGVPDQT